MKKLEPKIVSEVDIRKIEGQRFPREVLKWPDEFHINVTETALRAQDRLAERVASPARDSDSDRPQRVQSPLHFSNTIQQ